MILVRRFMYGTLGLTALTLGAVVWAYRTFRQADLP